ncbi:unnamed protein product [Blepharisma stoltei]|uniref:PPM-type phosphatase domain-containing protein n=1 Tax=Blepharisma stoltei TaxID=1481888 RepID=A0AAU9JZE9_9CILI|nr:unnamed protein product [Blepharisma stoltei]
MGCCSSAASRKNNEKLPPMSTSLREYPRKNVLNIKSCRQSASKKQKRCDVEFTVTNPVFAYSKRFNIDNKTLWASACVLPGFDPKGEIPKTCQDSCTFLNDENSVLLALFDGHGPEGDKVAKRCGEVTEKFFLTRKSRFEDDPMRLLNEITKRCDDDVQGSTKLDAYYSGATEVLVYYHNESLYCASLGDSRAILATTEPPETSPAPTALWGEEKKVLDEVKIRRNSEVNSKIKAIQLTKDQKPEDPEEHARIIKSGGRVQRTRDQNGNQIGPFRVWESTVNAPGLAMSRSIGDGMGTRIGVISTPICTEYQLKAESDYFIVVASDGIWDALDNQDVVNFVEYHRNKCRREIMEIPTDEVISQENACIAQLLCEEARARWFTIVEEEDVMIDDISCVILEMNESQFFIGKSEINKLPDIEPAVKRLDSKKHKVPSLDEVNLLDPRRSSIVQESMDILLTE